MSADRTPAKGMLAPLGALKTAGEVLQPYAGALDAFLAEIDAASAVPARYRHLILAAIYSAPTTRDFEAAGRAMAAAIENGASEAEALQAVLLATLIGIHPLIDYLGLALDPSDAAQAPTADDNADSAYWDDFERGFPGFRKSIETAWPELWARFNAVSLAAWKAGTIPAAWKELIFVAANVSTTHMYGRGAAWHIGKAKQYGATQAEVAGVLALACSTLRRPADALIAGTLTADAGKAP